MATPEYVKLSIDTERHIHESDVDSACMIDFDLLKRISKTRLRLGMSNKVCPCDPKNPNRGCIGSKCREEILKYGKCKCGLVKRCWINLEELYVLLKYYNIPEQEFNDWYMGQTGGVIDGVFYVYNGDFARFCANKKGMPYNFNAPDCYVKLAQSLITNKVDLKLD